MNKRHWYILLTYILTQFSSFFGVIILRAFDVPDEKIPGIWNIISFPIALVIILILLLPDIKNRHMIRGRATRSQAAGWAILGVFMVFGAQYVAAMLEMLLFGIMPGSENTELIVSYAKVVPAFIFIVAIIGPVLEEIVFRMIIFGALFKKWNFWIAALLSSLIFSIVHFDFEHVLIYTAVGFTFAYLYVKTKRILVPIIAHATLNSAAVLINIIYSDKIQEIVEKLEQIEQFIGGL